MTDPDRDPLDLVAEEFADRVRRGERPSVSDYVARHPDLADDLRDLLPAVAQMEMLKTVRRTSPAPAEAPPPKRLGDFRIVREIGRGGMGVVYEAIQESLGRRVALKLLPAHARMDPTKRERFLREAQAAAKLHHTNIVPVFGVGEQDGVPYYVMQYIPGCGLNDVIAGWRAEKREGEKGRGGEGETKPDRYPGRRDSTTKATRPAFSPPLSPSPPPTLPRPGQWHALARIGLAAASALQEAHDQGVLHRDVKPGNLLLDPRGHLWVTDFGLAKIADRDTLTATGDVVGTLQYMAPESLRGSADERSDVYGLGMTLYELFTLRLPFDESNPAILIREIGEKDAAPPRAVNPKVPRDLETIVLTAIAREPHRRYAAAADLADDLEAFLHDRPIRARRVSWVERVWRVCQRNPAVAGLSAVTAAALLFAAVFGWVMYGRAKNALARESGLRKDAEAAEAKEARLRADAEAAEAKEARLRADAEAAGQKLRENLQRSLETFEKVFEAARANPGPGPPRGPDGPFRPGMGGPGGPGPGGPRPEPLDAAGVLEPILEFYETYAKENATDPKLRFDAARAYLRVGMIQFRLGRQDKADAAYKRAAAMLDELHHEFPSMPEVRVELVFAYSRLPTLPPGDPGFRNQLAGFRRAATFGEAARGRMPNPGRLAAPALADVYDRLARMLDESGQRADAKKARDEAEKLRRNFPPPPDGFGPRPDRPPPGQPGRPPR